MVTSVLGHLKLANHEVDLDLGWTSLVEGARRSADVVRWYDCAGTDEASADTPGTLRSLGRLVFLRLSLPPVIAGAVLESTPSAPWASVPAQAQIVAADPCIVNGLYDAAAALHQHFLGATSRDATPVVTALLHLARPGLFPVLDLPIRRLYDEPAQRAWEAGERRATSPTRRSYLPVIRNDVLAAEGVIASWRSRLAASEAVEERRVATLSDVRLWEIMAHGLGSETPAHS